ncbi:hypothetical protein Trydic_g21152 [Trypoxylus dichotomus]
MHNSDMNGRLEETLENGKYVGGMGRVSYVLKEARRAAETHQTSPVIYLNAGDVYTDLVWRNPFTKKIAIEFMNNLKPDAACFGNHDLDYGLEHIRPFINRIKFPLVAANLHFTQATFMTEIVKASVVFKVKNVKVGIIGYISPKSHILHDHSHVVLEDEVEAVRREAIKLKSNEVHVIIALGYSGFEVDKKIAREVEGVDIVIGGMTNTLLWNGKPPHIEEVRGPYPLEIIQPSTRKKVLVATTYGFTKYMGKFLVGFDDNLSVKYHKAMPIFLDESVPNDATITHLLNTYIPALRKVQDDDRVIGKSVVILSNEQVRDEESNLANFITDAFVEFIAIRHGKPNAWTDSPIALINAGAIRKSINTSRTEPNVTRKMLTEVLPFRQRIVSVTLLGAVLLETLENGVRSNGETRGGEFLQVSGMRVTYDFTKRIGERVVEAKVFCDFCSYPVYEHINPNKHYSVLVNTFLANAGDGHYTFKRKALSLKPFQAYELDILSEVLKLYISGRHHTNNSDNELLDQEASACKQIEDRRTDEQLPVPTANLFVCTRSRQFVDAGLRNIGTDQSCIGALTFPPDGYSLTRRQQLLSLPAGQGCGGVRSEPLDARRSVEVVNRD